MRAQMKHVLKLHEQHDRGDHESPTPSGATKPTENHCRHCYVKQQHEVGEIRVRNHSDASEGSAGLLLLPLTGGERIEVRSSTPDTTAAPDKPSPSPSPLPGQRRPHQVPSSRRRPKKPIYQYASQRAGQGAS